MSTLLAFPIQACHETTVSEQETSIFEAKPTDLAICLDVLTSSLFQSAQPLDVQTIAQSEIIKETQTMLDNFAKGPIQAEIPYAIRVIEKNEILTFCHWRHVEFGYRAHLDYLHSLYDCDSQGFLVATNGNGDIIGGIFGMNLNKEIAFGGLYAVKSTYRCRGIGLQLWKQRLLHIGDRNMGINSVKSRVAPNQKVGMKLSFKMARYFGNPSQVSMLKYINRTTNLNNNVEFICLDEKKMLDSDLDALINYDATITLAKRELFLKQTLFHFEHTTTVMAISKTQNGYVVLGYGMLRPRYIGHTLGPIYAENKDLAQGILKELLTIYGKKRVETLLEITVVDDEGEVQTCSYQEALDEERRNVIKDLVNDLELNQECYLYRMYTKNDIKLPLYKTYAITSSEAFLL